MGYLNEDGLARYDGLIKNWVTLKSGTVDGVDPLLNWQKTATAGAVTCYPLPVAPLDPVMNFQFTETGPAEGTKGPDNPSTITGVTQAKVTRCGKNLLTRNPVSSMMSQRGITVTYNEDGSIHLKGTATSGYDAYMTYFNNASLGVVPAVMAAGKIFTVSITCSDSNVSGKIYDSNSLETWGVTVNVSPGTPVTHTMQSDVASAMFRIMVTRGSTVDCDVHCQIEYGQTATEWEAPTDADYTVNLGNTYYGGSIDLATGLMTVTWVAVVYDGTETINKDGTYGFYYTGGAKGPTIKNSTSFITTHFNSSGADVNKMVSFTDGAGTSFGWGTSTSASWGTASELQTWLAGQYANNTPVTVVYELASPYTVQLTAPQIRALAQPDKYVPRINTVYSDQTSVQVGYPKSPLATSTELTNAIISLGGNI